MKRNSYAKNIALVGLMAACAECGKLAFAFLPNIEVVTLLLALFGYVFGLRGVLASIVFVCIETLIYGFGPWVISYFIYWPLAAAVFMLLGKIKVKNRIILTLTAVLLTFFFGVLSSLVEVGLFSGNFDNFLYRFGIYYARGIVFYALQISCNLVLFLLLFPFLARKLKRIA